MKRHNRFHPAAFGLLLVTQSCNGISTMATTAPADVFAQRPVNSSNFRRSASSPHASMKVGCSKPEMAIFQCASSKKSAAICAASSRLILRYRDDDAVTVEITSTGSDGKAFLGGERGAVYQTSLRFRQDGADYVAFIAEPGAKADPGAKPWSGVTVFRGDTVVKELKCAETGDKQRIPSIDPGGIRVEQDDRSFGFL